LTRTRDTWLLDVDEMRLEQALGRFKPLRTYLYHPAIGKLIKHVRVSCQLGQESVRSSQPTV
jgi:hypothetical protein